jgi:phosphate:Na+ symporter
MWDLGITMAMSVVGGLGIFMLGMKYMSEGMQAVAGNSLRRMISLVTNNRFMATGVGMTVTMLVQSSTITTVLVVGLANANLMQLHQAIGVIFGANIGTTITGWILVLKVGKYGLPILGAAALIYLFIRRDKPRFIAMSIMGLGMVFFGLELMKDGFAPMKDMPVFIEAFAWFDATTYSGVLLAVLVGCVLTLIVQSSSATLGITIGLAATGVIPFQTAAALVMGENIGTTITVVLASIGATTHAKRVATAHVLFNLIGALWITAVFTYYIQGIAGIVESVHGTNPITITMDSAQFGAVVTAGIALSHSIFNILNTIFFLPFLYPFGRLLERIIKEPAARERPQLRHLDARAVDAPVLGVEQSRGEVIQMGRSAIEMLDGLREIGFNGAPNTELEERIFALESQMDTMHQEIVTFLTEILDANVPHSIAEEGRQQLRIAHEYESMSDRIASLLKGKLKLRDNELELPPAQQDELLELISMVSVFVNRVTRAYEERRAVDPGEATDINKGITRRVKQLREEHLTRVTDTPMNARLSLIYTDLLTDFRRVRAHALNIHEATMGDEAFRTAHSGSREMSPTD